MHRAGSRLIIERVIAFLLGSIEDENPERCKEESCRARLGWVA